MSSFNYFYKRATTKILDQAKDIVKENIENTIDSKLPILTGIVTVGLFLLSMYEPNKSKVITETKTKPNKS